MKILAWIFIILGIFSFLLGAMNLGVEMDTEPGTTDWIIERKLKRKPFINAAINFVIAGILFGIAREKKDVT